MMSRTGHVPNLIISGKKSPTHFSSNFPSTDQKKVDLKGEELNISFQTEDELRVCNTAQYETEEDYFELWLM